MNKEQAIEEIEAQAEAGVTAFQVISMTEEDIVEYAGKSIVRKFESLAKEQKNAYMQELIDDIYDVIEEHPDYGFKKLIRKAIECRIEDGTETLA